MSFVSKPDRFGSCAIIPGRVSDDDGFATENTIIEGLHGPITLYFSATGVRQLAQRYPQLALVPKGQLELAREHLASTETLLAEAVEALEAAEVQLDRISGLQREGFKVVRVMGRPPLKKEAKV